MLVAAAVAAGLLLLLVLAAPRLAGATWPLRAPSCALLLWQALGLAGGLLAVLGCATAALAPHGDTHLRALAGVDASAPWWSWAAGLLGLAVLLRLLQVLLTSTARTLATRRRHRALLDLVATRNPLLRGTHVVDHAVPVAYCVPGLRSRVVVSRGVLTALQEDEVRAVLAHERAHVAQRHDLVVLPFVALGATFPWLPAVRRAQEQVALLVEVLADRLAARRHGGPVLARALGKVAGGRTPAGGLGAGGDDVLVRACRLLDPPPPLPRAALALVLLAAGGVALLPPLVLAVPVILAS